MSDRPEVVVVDGLRETTEVLQAVLEPRGMRVCRESSGSTPADEAGRSRILVLHDDLPVRETPRVIVGRVTPDAPIRPDDCRSLPQPFDYRDLIAAIDALADPAA